MDFNTFQSNERGKAISFNHFNLDTRGTSEGRVQGGTLSQTKRRKGKLEENWKRKMKEKREKIGMKFIFATNVCVKDIFSSN